MATTAFQPNAFQAGGQEPQTAFQMVDNPLPFNQYDWPLPKVAIQPERTIAQNFLLPYPTILLPVPFDWSLDTQPFRPDATWISAPIPVTAAVQFPFNQYDWPLPKVPAQPAQNWTLQFPLELIGKDVLPHNQYDWPLQRQQPIPGPTIAQSFPLELIGQDKLPALNRDWPLPQRPLPPAFTWTWQYNLNLVGKDVLPHNQYDWPLPKAPTRPDATHVFTPPTPGFLLAPFRQQDWPLTRIPPLLPFGQTTAFPLTLIGKDALPFRQQDWPLPSQPPRPNATWLQFVIPPAAQLYLPVPFDWSLEAQPFRPDATWISAPVPVTAAVQFPFNQFDWPLPRTAAPIAFNLTASFNLNLIGQDQLPHNQYDWPLPRGPQFPPVFLPTSNINLYQPPITVSVPKVYISSSYIQ
jgi:hypothetical protein